MQWEIYTTGGGYYLYDVFNMLAAYTGSGNFRNLIQIGIIVGIGWSAVQLAFGGNLGSTMKYIMTMIVVMMLALMPKSSVVIIDKTMGTIPIYGIVDNVPTSVAILGHYTSAVSYYVTGQMETLLSTPTDLTYQKNGILFGSTLLAQAANWRAVSPKIHENLVNYMQQCTIDPANLGHMDLEMLATNGDMEGFITANMPASMAYYDVTTGQTRTCSAGWADVRASVTSEVNAVLAQKAAEMFQGANATGPANIARLQGTLGDFQGMMAMSSASAVSTIKQAMYVNALDDGMMRFIATSGNSAAMDIYQVARADIQTRSSYAAIGANAAKWVPLLKIVFETLYYAAFPLAVLMMMTPMGPAVLKGYCGGFVWIAAWEPLSAILHSIVIKASAGFYRSAGAVTSDGSVSDVVLSWANHFGIRAVEQDVGTVAGFLMMSVPFLASAIMFGANRMTGMATSMLNVSQGAAIETGREAATGSIGLGNLSMNNYAGNKMNMSSVMDTGRESITAGNGGIVTRNADGTFSIQAGSSVSNGGINAQASQMVRSELSRRADESRTAASSAASELSDYISNGASELTAFSRSVTSGEMYSSGESSDITQNGTMAVRNAFSKVEEFAQKHGISAETAMRATIAAQLGAGGGAGLSASATLGATGSIDGKSGEDFHELVRAAQDAGLTHELTRISSARSSLGTSKTAGSSDGASEDKRFSLDEGQRLAETYVSRLDEAQSYATAASRMESAGVALDTNLNQMFANQLIANGYDPLEDAPRIMSPVTPEQMEAKDRILGEMVDQVVDQLVPAAPTDPTAGYSVETDRSSFATAPARSTRFRDGESMSIYDASEELAEKKAFNEEMVNGDFNLFHGEWNKEWQERKAEVGGTNSALESNMDQTIGGAMMRRMGSALGITDNEMTKLKEAHPEAWSSPGTALDYYANNPEKYQEVIGRPFGEGAPEMMAPVSTGQADTAPNAGSLAAQPATKEAPAPAMTPRTFTPEERDLVVRTMLGEAASEGDVGLAAVALVIRNRADDKRFPDGVGAVATQGNGKGIHQFSVWNDDGSGNNLPSRYNPGDKQYERAAYILDVVMGGLVPDFTEGATHYYSPAGMRQLVETGYQKNLIPGWLNSETAGRDAPNVQIGGHIFTGQVKPKE
ncbi:conjugal transfer protein TraG N-terminal domain-containing protein [Pseudomonas sp. GX19020]|uniref:conjugal transfer protein TraG N-terminal domain-containing protein n=1 Tax=Pseudomonas sp. GX19020 TaxID=2942277 RepID=UPI0020187B27|nr:conjugal transfer protein TraG N-terminal domain-containing protein [Pseudomonas sp. GX19020]MCL4068149.1 conjugal transfer protein TraG N-terminal domain-containing protein [Pseudomonas sp. GX19020]